MQFLVVCRDTEIHGETQSYTENYFFLVRYPLTYPQYNPVPSVWLCVALCNCNIFAYVKAPIGTDIQTAAALLPKRQIGGHSHRNRVRQRNGLDEAAVLSIFRAKKRPDFDPLILHAPIWKLHWPWHPKCRPKPGNWPKRFGRSAYVGVAQNGAGALRGYFDCKPWDCGYPQHPLTQDLLRSPPLSSAAPSANPFGYISPTSGARVQENLGDEIDYILDGGPRAPASKAS